MWQGLFDALGLHRPPGPLEEFDLPAEVEVYLLYGAVDAVSYTHLLRADFCKELTIDQSIAHNGVCLTGVDIRDDTYTAVSYTHLDFVDEEHVARIETREQPRQIARLVQYGTRRDRCV